MMQIARRGDLSLMFMQLISPQTISFIAERTDVYAKREWVVPTPRLDRDGNITARRILSAIYPRSEKELPPNARHRWVLPKGMTLYLPGLVL